MLDLSVKFLRFVFLNYEVNWLEIFATGIFTLVGALSGALSGAFLAGKYAIDVVKKQLDYDQKSKRIEELEPYLKLTAIFLFTLIVAIRQAEKTRVLLDKEICDKSEVSMHTHKMIEMTRKSLDRADEELEKINLKIIPYEHYSQYALSDFYIKDLKDILNSLYKNFNKPLNKPYYIKNSDYYNSLPITISFLRTLHEEMEVNIQESISELKLL